MGFGADAPLTATLLGSFISPPLFVLNNGDDSVDLVDDGITEKPCTSTWLQVVIAISSNSGSLMIVRLFVIVMVGEKKIVSSASQS
jgi:hypothetical protein